MAKRYPGSRRTEETIDVGLVDHHPAESHELRPGLAQRIQVLAEQAAVELERVHGTSAKARALDFRQVVGGILAPCKFHASSLLQILDHARALDEERIEHGFVRVRPEHIAQIGERLVPAVVYPRLGRKMTGWNPNRSAGERGRATEVLGLLHKQRIEAFQLRHQRGAHAGRAGPDDHDVAFFIPALRRRVHSGIAAAIARCMKRIIRGAESKVRLRPQALAEQFRFCGMRNSRPDESS